MKTLDEWLELYGVNHQNRTNQLIHKVCVPLIFWSIVALLWKIRLGPLPLILPVSSVLMVFYFRLGFLAGAFIFLQLLIGTSVAVAIDSQSAHLTEVALGVFVFAWLGQFYGHKLEGRSPSFLQDLQFLLIGPLWVVPFFKPNRKKN